MVARTSRSIPLPIKRRVRQRCGFGCVICGLPIFEYDHMLGFANTDRHVADEITLLCPLHHTEVTNGLLSRAEVEAANSDPFNLRAGHSRAHPLHYSGAECEVHLGTLRFDSPNLATGRRFHVLVIDDVSLLSLRSDGEQLLLNFSVHTDDGQLLLRIIDNELEYSALVFDVELVGRNLKLREAHGSILLDITFGVPNRIDVRRAHFRIEGADVVVHDDLVMVPNNHLTFLRCHVQTVRSTGFRVRSPDVPFRNAALEVVVTRPSRSPSVRAAAAKWVQDTIRKHREVATNAAVAQSDNDG